MEEIITITIIDIALGNVDAAVFWFVGGWLTFTITILIIITKRELISFYGLHQGFVYGCASYHHVSYSDRQIIMYCELNILVLIIHALRILQIGVILSYIYSILNYPYYFSIPGIRVCKKVLT